MSSFPNLRSGLSDPNRAIASAYVMRGIGRWIWKPAISGHSRSTRSSATSTTSSLVTNDISRSTWVNSGCRSARKSSSRKHRTSWK